MASVTLQEPQWSWHDAMRLDKKNYSKAINWSLIWIFSGLIFLVFGVIKYNDAVCSCPMQLAGTPSTCSCVNQAAVFSLEWGVVFLAVGIAIQVLARRWRIIRSLNRR